MSGIALLGRYAKKKLQELQDKETSECLAHARKQHHFDSNQRTCNMTMLSMIPTLRDTIMQALDTESLTALLKDNPPNKLEIWGQLKTMSMTRCIVAVYTSSMLIVFLRVQLNIIGGYMYQDTLLSTGDGLSSTHQATSQVQQRYLAVVQYLLQNGISDLTHIVLTLVTQNLQTFSLKDQISIQDIDDLVAKVRSVVEHSPLLESCVPHDMAGLHPQSGSHVNHGTALAKYMLPPDAGLAQAASMTEPDLTLQTLMQETRDMLDSEDFHLVLTVCLDHGFNYFQDRLAEYFKPLDPSSSPELMSMPLAKVIPIMNGLINVLLGDSPNQFVQELLLKEQVKDFAANVYEAFSQPSAAQGPA